jgi:hypothetical protein
MLSPLLIAKNKMLVPCDESFFDGIGTLDKLNNKMAINVDSDGSCNFEWIIDFNGLYYKLNKIGISKETFLTRIGWDRRQCIFNIEPPTPITCGELRKKLSDFSDEFSDIPNLADLLTLIAELKDDHILSMNEMRIYHNHF